MTLTRTTTGWDTSGRVVTRADQIVMCHGDPFGASESASLGAQVRATVTPVDGLHATGRLVHQPWTSSNWGTNVDPHNLGGHGLAAIDTAAPSGMVHLIGWSMGGCNVAVWASRHPERVASLTLISPAHDILDVYTRARGNALFDSMADEIATCWGGSAGASSATIAAALTAAGADIDSLTASLVPLAERIWLVCALDDSVGLAPAAQTLATNLALPADRAVFFTAGGTGTHPAPYRTGLGWDPLTTLRQVDTWS